jgi:DNA (cytosine-5)-methyltransferase 1
LSTTASTVDIFCGAGGLSLGFKQAGLSISAGVDMDPSCQYPYESNVGAKFVLEDAATLTPQTLSKLFAQNDVRVLAGCAPCQPFSGYTTKRRHSDRRWELLVHFLRLAKAALPDVVTLENVPRLVHLPLWQSFVHELKTAGYYVSWSVVDAAHYGVPQARRRLVLLASRLAPIALPAGTPNLVATVRDVIGTLPEVEAGAPPAEDNLHASRALTDRNLARIKASNPAGTWRQWPNKMRAKCHTKISGKTYPSVYGRMSWDRPSPTITTQFYGFGNGRFGHPEQDRALTLREGALLQTFPVDFVFVKPGSRLNFRSVGKLIGNAVPPKLAFAIGRAIVAHIDEHAVSSAKSSRGMPRRPSSRRRS